MIATQETLQFFHPVLIGRFLKTTMIDEPVERQLHVRGPGAEGRNKGMKFRITEIVKIENPRHYAAHAVEGLRRLLLEGGRAERDPRREHFFNLEGDTSAYYIHISPITGNVVLLARWSRQPADCYFDAEHMVA
jgi:hypothetical protein